MESKKLDVDNFMKLSNPESLINNQMNPNNSIKNDNSTYKPSSNRDKNSNYNSNFNENYRNQNRNNNNYRNNFNNYKKKEDYRTDGDQNSNNNNNYYNKDNNRQKNSNHYSNNYNSSNNYNRNSYYKSHPDLNDILFEIHKVFPNTDEKVLKEIQLHKKITLEEIINILCFNHEIQKIVEENNKSVKKNLCLNNHRYENEKDEKDHHIEFILIYKVDDSKDSRRPLKVDNNCKNVIKIVNFNYIPILCQANHLKEEEKLSCFKSHNQNEIDYHFIKFKTFYCKDQNCSMRECPLAHGSTDFRNLFHLSSSFKNKSLRDINLLKKMLNGSKFLQGIIVKSYNNSLPEKFDLSTYKVFKCPLAESCYVDYHLCLNYHDEKERRRDPNFLKIERNEYCPNILGDGKNLLVSTKCPAGDFCEFFHSRNELNYDKRNFRTIIDCTRNNRKPCDYYDVCYGKHYDDKGKIIISKLKKNSEGSKEYIQLQENLIISSKQSQTENSNLSKELEEIETKLKSIKCNNLICSVKFSSSLRVLTCKHYFCKDCFDKIIFKTETCNVCNKNFNKERGYYKFNLDEFNK